MTRKASRKRKKRIKAPVPNMWFFAIATENCKAGDLVRVQYSGGYSVPYTVAPIKERRDY